MKARLINENINTTPYEIKNKSFVDCVSKGDKILKINPIEDEHDKWIGMIFKSGIVKNEYIIWAPEIVVTDLGLGNHNTKDLLIDKLIESDYILCFDNRIAMYITDIKEFAATLGVKMGEVFSQGSFK